MIGLALLWPISFLRGCSGVGGRLEILARILRVNDHQMMSITLQCVNLYQVAYDQGDG